MIQTHYNKLPFSDVEMKCFCRRWFTTSYSPGFKWFGSLTNLSTRRPSPKANLKAALEHDGSLCDARSAVVENQPVDDMEPCPHNGSYICSSHMYTHVGTVPRSEKQKKTFRGLKEKKKKGEEEEGASGGKGQWKEEDHVRESPLLSALASLSQSSLDRPLPTTPTPSSDSPLTSAPESCFSDPIRSKDDPDRSVRSPSNMATNDPKAVSVQDVYVPMDRIVEAAHSHMNDQTERLHDHTGSQETTRTVNCSQEVATVDRWEGLKVMIPKIFCCCSESKVLSYSNLPLK